MVEKFFTAQKMSTGKSGPNLLILGSVHGNEQCGAKIMPELEKTINLVRGSLTLVIGNPEAYLKNVRYTDNDLNRMFLDDNIDVNFRKGSYEYQRAMELKHLIMENDILLDLHSSTSRGTTPFAICEDNGVPYLKSAPINYIVSGFDSVQPGGTDWFANSVDKVGICVECGYLGDDNCDSIAMQTSLSLLQSLEMIDVDYVANNEMPRHLRLEEMYKTSTNFSLAKELPDFSFVDSGVVVGFDGNKTVVLGRGGYMLFARDCDGPNQEGFVVAR